MVPENLLSSPMMKEEPSGVIILGVLRIYVRNVIIVLLFHNWNELGRSGLLLLSLNTLRLRPAGELSG